MFVVGEFAAMWVFPVGPLLGGIVAALIYDQFLAKGQHPGIAPSRPPPEESP